MNKLLGKTLLEASFTPLQSGLFQRRCSASGQRPLAPSPQTSLQCYTTDSAQLAEAPPMVHGVLRLAGQPLDRQTRTFMESRFGQDFSQVRVHTDAKATDSARAVNAIAYTVGQQIVLQNQAFQPRTSQGKQLIAHELTHTLQQRSIATGSAQTVIPIDTARSAEHEANQIASQVLAGQAFPEPTSHRAPLQIQRQTDTPDVTVRSPVFEETVTQLSDIAGAVSGRPLNREEQILVQGVFRSSIDYSRVRLIPIDFLEYRTVGNSIYIPQNFSINTPDMAQTLIHEMTHVWQYQHGGTSYISISLGAQIAAQISQGNRNFAYAYQISPGQSFFDFMPEQQALLVENYFAMLRDQAAIPAHQAAGEPRTYNSNHFGADGFPTQLSAADRLAEISRELPLHQPLIQQMQAALPRPEIDILQLRASEVMRVPHQELFSVPAEREIAPVRPLLEVRF